MLSKFILLAVILLLFVAITYRRESFEGNLFGLQALSILNNNRDLSTMLYFKKEDEDVYLQNYNELNPISLLNEPLIMNRCIQFVYEGNNGGIDGIINGMYRDGKCFVSSKISVDVSNYDTIERALKRTLLQLYVDSNRVGYVPQFYGPTYVLITQYPYIRTIKRDCSTMPTSLQWNSPLDLYSPKPVDNVDGCEEVKTQITTQLIRVEMYLLFPAHDIIISNRNRIVGSFKYKKWEEIRCNMRRLFAYNPDYVPGVFTVNPRSFDEKCKVACLNETDNTYKYACGARNSINNSPYESTVLGTSEFHTTDKIKVSKEERRHDYANLFLINSGKMNTILNMSSENGILRDCIEIQPIPEDFNMNYSCTPSAVNVLPTTPQTLLKDIRGVTFNISIGNRNLGYNKCLAYVNKTLRVDNCGPEKYKQWSIEGVRVKGEGEDLYRIYTYDGTRKLYLTKRGREPIMTGIAPSLTLYKPRTDKQLMLVDILRKDGTIDRSSNEQYCLTITENKISFEPSSIFNKNITLLPISNEDEVCGKEIDKGVYSQLLQSAKDQLAK